MEVQKKKKEALLKKEAPLKKVVRKYYDESLLDEDETDSEREEENIKGSHSLSFGRDLKTVFEIESSEEILKRKAEGMLPLDITKRDKVGN